MSRDQVIGCEGLGKQYRLGAPERYRTLRELIVSTARRPWQLLSREPASADRTFWALRNVSFSIARGETVGVIGRNGAGKSTLLKVLSRITRPTTGSAVIHGRLASLLEVGTGFHLELTGRENVMLNGAILGMKRSETLRRFDEIIAFADIHRFVDTPVKHYSSGMYLRLAFAVAAHLNPEVLIVDEVLAVGDAAFQRKCLSKMEEVGRSGRTVLFVSHNMPAVTRLCPRAILLDKGQIVDDGPSHRVAGTYLRGGLGSTAVREWNDIQEAPGNDIVRLRGVRVRDQRGDISEAIDIRQPVQLEIDYAVTANGHVLSANFHVFNEEGVCVFALIDSDVEYRDRPKEKGLYRSTATIPGNLLAEGSLIVGAAVSTMASASLHVYEREAVAFQVIDSGQGDSARVDYRGTMPGVVRPLVPWRTQRIAD